MPNNEALSLLSYDLHLKYTHQRYLPLAGIEHRLKARDGYQKHWLQLKQEIQSARKSEAIFFKLDNIDRNFWFYPADCINKKTHQVEALGNKIYEKIENRKTFKKHFQTNARVEEAISSAIYEGANSTRHEAKVLITESQSGKDKDQKMLLNNYAAMMWTKEHATLPITVELILKIHEIITRDTLEGDDVNFYGKFRDDAVYVGSHRGVAHQQITSSLDQVISLIDHHPRYLHPLIQGILLHYFIAYIHPFFDGNGRTARSLFYFKTFQNDLKFVELLSISADLKNRGKKYSNTFKMVEEYDLDMTYFVDFCLDSLLKALQIVQKKIGYLLSLSSLGLNPNKTTLLQRMALNRHHGVSIEEYTSIIGKSREAARKELKELSATGLLSEKRQGKKYLYFVEKEKLKAAVVEKNLEYGGR